MSIYATELSFDADDHDPKCAKWVKVDGTGKPGVDWHRLDTGPNEYWRLDEATACTCRCGPIAYQGSHVFPSDDDPRTGALDFSSIPGFLTRDGYDAEHQHGETVQPWIRVGVDHDREMLLDRDQVGKIYRYLGDWLDRVRT